MKINYYVQAPHVHCTYYTIEVTNFVSHSLGNPAANPAHPGTQLAILGKTVAIDFYASGLPRTQAGNYTWWHNDAPITHGTFEKDKRRLVIHNVQESHSGEYRFRVLLRFSTFLQLSASASTQLLVVGE